VFDRSKIQLSMISDTYALPTFCCCPPLQMK
jgi:hypothetical protein